MRTIFAGFLISLFSLATTSAAIVITGFGSTGESGASPFTVDTTNTNFGFTQTASEILINGSDSGSILAGTFTSVNITGQNTIQLTLKVTGTNPNSNFSVELFDPTFTLIRTYTGNFASFGSSFTQVTLKPSATNPTFTSIAGFQFTANGSGTAVNATLDTLTAVPEPSSYAFMILGLSVVSFMAKRKMGAA